MDWMCSSQSQMNVDRVPFVAPQAPCSVTGRAHPCTAPARRLPWHSCLDLCAIYLQPHASFCRRCDGIPRRDRDVLTRLNGLLGGGWP